MQKQQVLIDNRFFVFECLRIGRKKDPDFTYLTDKGKMPKILETYFDLLRTLGNVENFQKEIRTNFQWHYHSVEEPTQLDLIRRIFQASKKEEKWIDQNILSGVVYQIKCLNNSWRLFFHQKTIGDFLIIQPLFLDVNHLVYRDDKYERNYNSCLVCHGKKCQKE